MDKGGKMTILMACFWPVLFITSIAMSLVSWLKLRQQIDKVYFSVKGWALAAYIAFVGTLLAYAPLAITAFGMTILFIMVFTIIFILSAGKKKHPRIWRSSLIMLIASFYTTGVGIDAQAAYSPQTRTITKSVGLAQYQKVKKEHQTLLAAQKAVLLAYAPLEKKVNKLEAEKAAAAKAKAEQEAKAKKAAAAAKKAAEAAAASQAKAASEASAASSESSSTAQRGDMNTADSQKIVGNRNSKIYHVPGQAGYRMNSANAVYFNSEQEAINAGYRKAKR